MATITLLADFTIFGEDFRFGSPFTLSGFTFTDLGPPASFINTSGAVKGLQFPNAGEKVRLPAVTGRVTINVAAFAGPITLIGRNTRGREIVRRIVPGDNAPHTIVLTMPGVARVDFMGGDNEGVIISMSMKVTVESNE